VKATFFVRLWAKIRPYCLRLSSDSFHIRCRKFPSELTEWW